MGEIIGADPALDAARSAAGGVTRRSLIYAAPALAVVGLAALFASRLGVDPSQIPSNLIGKRVPIFSLPPVQGRTLGLSSDDLHGEVSLVNVFASWCVACREEHPLLLRLKNDGSVPIHGLNCKDHPDDAARGSTRWAIPIREPAPIATAGWRSTGASTACRRRSWSGRTGPSRTSTSVR
jgi:thiol-disulfide isomerase/thioredoxin